MQQHEELREETFEKGLDFALWKRLYRYATAYRWDLGCLAALGTATAAIDVALPLVTRRVVDDVVAGVAVDFGQYALVYGVLVAAISLTIAGFIHFAGKIRTNVAHDVRRDAFDNLQRLSFSYFDKKPVGWLMSRMTSDCERLSNIMAWGTLDLFWGFTLMGGIAVVMFAMNAKLAAIVLAVVPLLALASGFFQKRILASSRLVRRTNSRITAAYNEAIMGIRTSKIFVREDANLKDFRNLSDEMFGASVRNALQSALFLPTILSLGSVATALALAAGGIDVSRGAITVGTLIAFMTYTRHFFDPVQELGHWFAELQMAQASAERVLGLIETQPDIQDSKEMLAQMASHTKRLSGNGSGVAEIHVGDTPLAADGLRDDFTAIEFDDVSFAYGTDKAVLTDFNLMVTAGETIALVGETGSGKSTIVNLLCRFYEPTSGEIRFDGIDYRNRSLHWLQSKLGIVLQEPHLFSGSVASNIRYGRLEASQSEVEDAARLVGAHAFIQEMDGGYGADVGEGGNRLSTGQKQLISFARAILANPAVLVMDEATSSVDTETERQIQRGLDEVLTGRTSFVIAHRLSTIRSADRILVISEGRILEAGSHLELLERRGHYHDLYTRQSLRESTRPETAWDRRALELGET